MVQLLNCREAKRKTSEALSYAQISYDRCQALKLERICYETLLYYAILHESGSNILIDSSTWKLIDNYFSTSPLPSDGHEKNWPILGMPYKVFRSMKGSTDK